MEHFHFETEVQLVPSNVRSAVFLCTKKNRANYSTNEFKAYHFLVCDRGRDYILVVKLKGGPILGQADSEKFREFKF